MADNSTQAQVAETPSPLAGETAPSRSRWFHIRWRFLILISLVLAIPLTIYGWRQYRQKKALAELTERGAIVRTEPLAFPFVEQLAGEEYAKQIIEVYWVNADVSEEDLSMLKGIGSLRKVELTNSKVDEDGLRHLVGLKSLYTLHLAGTQVGDDPLVHVSKIPELGILSLNETRVTDRGLAHLAEMSRLERIHLDGSAVTDEGLAHLAKMTQLKELSLKELPITDKGLLQLKELKNLEVVGLANNPNLTADGIVALKRALPKLHISLPVESGPGNPASRKKAGTPVPETSVGKKR